MTGVVSESSSRLHALDALRGVAAFVVMLSHCLLILERGPPSWIDETPLRLFINGHAAVVIFFVLSGYVLSIPFGGTQPAYSRFLLRRVCRIYLPFVAAVLFAALLYSLTPHAMAGVGSPWFHYNWEAKPLSLKVLIEHLLMTGRAQDMWLNPIMWSLVYELRISLIFPLLLLLCRSTLAGAVLAGACFAGGAAALSMTGAPSLQFAYELAPTLALTLYYASYFMLGILLAKGHATIDALVKRAPAAVVAGLFLLALLLLDLPRAAQQFDLSVTMPIKSASAAVWKFVPEGLQALGAGLLIALVRALGSARSRFNPLRTRPVEWLGKVSYSLYLVHYPIAFFVARRLLGEVPFPLIVLAIISLSLTASALLHFLVERPSMALGRRFLEPRRPALA